MNAYEIGKLVKQSDVEPAGRADRKPIPDEVIDLAYSPTMSEEHSELLAPLGVAGLGGAGLVGGNVATVLNMMKEMDVDPPEGSEKLLKKLKNIMGGKGIRISEASILDDPALQLGGALPSKMKGSGSVAKQIEAANALIYGSKKRPAVGTVFGRNLGSRIPIAAHEFGHLTGSPQLKLALYSKMYGPWVSALPAYFAGRWAGGDEDSSFLGAAGKGALGGAIPGAVAGGPMLYEEVRAWKRGYSGLKDMVSKGLLDRSVIGKARWAMAKALGTYAMLAGGISAVIGVFGALRARAQARNKLAGKQQKARRAIERQSEEGAL